MGCKVDGIVDHVWRQYWWVYASIIFLLSISMILVGVFELCDVFNLKGDAPDPITPDEDPYIVPDVWVQETIEPQNPGDLPTLKGQYYMYEDANAQIPEDRWPVPEEPSESVDKYKTAKGIVGMVLIAVGSAFFLFLVLFLMCKRWYFGQGERENSWSGVTLNTGFSGSPTADSAVQRMVENNPIYDPETYIEQGKIDSNWNPNETGGRPRNIPSPSSTKATHTERLMVDHNGFPIKNAIPENSLRSDRTWGSLKPLRTTESSIDSSSATKGSLPNQGREYSFDSSSPLSPNGSSIGSTDGNNIRRRLLLDDVTPTTISVCAIALVAMLIGYKLIRRYKTRPSVTIPLYN